MTRHLVYIVVILICGQWALGTNWYSGNVSIGAGDLYGSGYLWNSATLSMTGGQMQSLNTFGSSSTDISGGVISSGIDVYESSNLTVSGGQVGGYLEAYDNGTVTLSGGSISGWVYAEDGAVINVYGYDFNYDPTGGNKNGGELRGIWAGGEAFTLDFLDNLSVGSTYYGHVSLHEIPEPATLLLVGLGGLILRNRRK
jgi:hypothetical protein